MSYLTETFKVLTPSQIEALANVFSKGDNSVVNSLRIEPDSGKVARLQGAAMVFKDLADECNAKLKDLK